MFLQLKVNRRRPAIGDVRRKGMTRGEIIGDIWSFRNEVESHHQAVNGYPITHRVPTNEKLLQTVLITLLTVSLASAEVTLYVAPDGKDGGPGTRAAGSWQGGIGSAR